MIVFDKLWETMKAKHVSTYALRDRFDIDSIKVGKFADLVVLDNDLNIKMVIARGKIAVDNR